MLSIITILLIGIIIGFIIWGVLYGDKNVKGEDVDDKKLNPKELNLKKEREEIEEKILEELTLRQAQGNSKGIANDDVQELLGVADSTATKYLQRLEESGKIKQVGDTGSGVYYVKR